MKAFRAGKYATLSVESQPCPGSGQPMPLQVRTGPLGAQCEGESLEVVMVSKVCLCTRNVYVWMEGNADLLVKIQVV